MNESQEGRLLNLQILCLSIAPQGLIGSKIGSVTSQNRQKPRSFEDRKFFFGNAPQNITGDRLDRPNGDLHSYLLRSILNIYWCKM